MDLIQKYLDAQEKKTPTQKDLEEANQIYDHEEDHKNEEKKEEKQENPIMANGKPENQNQNQNQNPATPTTTTTTTPTTSNSPSSQNQNAKPNSNATSPSSSTSSLTNITTNTTSGIRPSEAISVPDHTSDERFKQGFAPTEEWLRSWKRVLPLNTIIRLLNVLVPQIEKICVERGIVSEEEILKYLSSGTLVGLLPVPHPIMIRKYKPHSGTYVWATVTMWGIIYLRNLNPPIWLGTKVSLFFVRRM